MREIYSVFQSAEVQKLWVLGKRQEAKVKREEKYVYLTSLGNAIIKKEAISCQSFYPYLPISLSH
ncbi:hypothetical protein MICAE_1490019 [Microcystis aeruginosa PCC 9806]|uniref:Programmed cell death toxin YdcE n=1 Tax=Microcystis aeruginosa PCC 9806 TaxID=1160282 RepID=I4GSH1_MICAE|nr:hypothetical protein MICAE_1490019 [Microcystis aeruginosa PCC 9806]